MSTDRIRFAGMIPVAHQRIYLADSTAISIDATVRTLSRMLMISAETNPARWSMSLTPTLTTGNLLRTDPGVFFFDGFNGTANLKFQRQTGVSVVQIEGFRFPGDPTS